MNYFERPRYTQAMIAYKTLTECFWESQSRIALWEFYYHAKIWFLCELSTQFAKINHRSAALSIINENYLILPEKPFNQNTS